MSEFFTVVTFVSLCSSRLRLIELAHALFLLHLWLLLMMLLNCVEVHRVTSSEGIMSFSHLQCVVFCALHLLFSLTTVDVNKGIDYFLKLL